jgi:hypothetical protein
LKILVYVLHAHVIEDGDEDDAQADVRALAEVDADVPSKAAPPL